ncbi:uncharacterized protein LOC129581265 [Paramacrobiotus metropolitanus]|uniref:uncharacterized protein LOC129581265 n=1 Tax=Paramacrobiotus metropolitanus TaxID=2943436 RepID=UPI002446026A|nr:uncharacterized protein LOC129581265 [Paramacrobiotus metropolitanus]
MNTVSISAPAMHVATQKAAAPKRMADLTSSVSVPGASSAASARASRFSRGGSGGGPNSAALHGSMSIDHYSSGFSASSPPAGIPGHRKSVSAIMSTRRPSVSNDSEYQYYPPQRRVILGRPARVFWDLENCAIGGRDYMAEIMRTIQTRVEQDTGVEVFEIFASYHHASHIPNEIYQELVAYDVNFNKVQLVENADSKNSVEDDIYREVDKFIDTQSQRTHLFPYVLVIAGHVSLIDKIDPLEKRGKIVYAIRKDKDTNFGNTLGKHVVYEYSMTKGIQNRIN